MVNRLDVRNVVHELNDKVRQSDEYKLLYESLLNSKGGTLLDILWSFDNEIIVYEDIRESLNCMLITPNWQIEEERDARQKRLAKQK